ncbi:DUF4199 domain-containing protein [Pontibacter arcticus]|uniref:DUF4199 domain-containing protein n=1 Tax=Pontibacter arcticus TaxID=2080288 RepID=A0A364RBQ5_9BACT|nr:DUF4199 domain-containing protein [Pontibacter arcticus]RAU81596.1 DUF4199 domain-containing protein [Pontibacter arcticus]
MNETQTQPSVMSVALKYGGIAGLIIIVYTLILLVVDLSSNQWLMSVGYLILIALIVLAMKAYKESNYGYMSYGQGLGIGTVVSAVAGLLGGIFMWIYTSFIDTAYMANMMEKQIMELENQGMSDEQIDAAMSMASSFQGPGMMVIGSLIGYIIVGFLLSLIISAIMKNSRPQFE